MGDWMSVYITGTCNEDELEALQKAIAYDMTDSSTYENFHCLSAGEGLSGLNDWSGNKINAMGNVSERNYTPQDVAERLAIIANTVPSLKVKVHCGGAYESKECIATVVLENGISHVGDPEMEIIPELPDDVFLARLTKAMKRP